MEIEQKTALEIAWSLINDHFSRSRPARLIRGIVTSGKHHNVHGRAYIASGLQEQNQPVPLLLNHDPMTPVGRVLSFDVDRDQIKFAAELCNDPGLGFFARRCNDIWARIVSGEIVSISKVAENLGAPVFDGTYYHFRINEVSLVLNGADEGARITKVFERDSKIYIDGRSSMKIHWDSRVSA